MQVAPRIDNRFKSLIPPLSPDEYALLEANILLEGCREPLVTWRGILVDGHNRLSICQRHGIPYETTSLRMRHRQRVALWIIDNQSGRRNLTDAQRIELAAGKVAFEAKGGERDGSAKSGAVGNTRKVIAGEAGVCEETVRRYLRIRDYGSDELVQQVRSGRLTIGAAHRRLEAEIDTVQSYKFRPGPKDIARATQDIAAQLAEIGALLPALTQGGGPHRRILSLLAGHCQQLASIEEAIMGGV